MLRPSHAQRLCLLILLFLLPACGVTFRETFEGTELLQSMSLEGDRTVGSEMTVHLTVTQGYPVPVRIVCAYEDGDQLSEDQKKLGFPERATRVADEVIPPAPDSSPDQKNLPQQELTFTFKAPQKGSYFIACFTPAAEENGLGVAFKIRDP